MKHLFLSLFVVLALSSCKSTFFQVATTQCDNLKSEQNTLFFEDANCKVYYNLWSEGGNAGFLFHNKSDLTIYVNLAESFFVKNGIAYDYSLNRTFARSVSQSFSNQQTVSLWGFKNGLPVLNSVSEDGKASKIADLSVLMPGLFGGTDAKEKSTATSRQVTYSEEPIVAIPPHTAKYFSEYSIYETLFRDCNLLLYPSKKQVRPLKFTSANSPVTFSNIITYSMRNSGDDIQIKNDFYISEIKNLPQKVAIKKVFKRDCDNREIKEWHFTDAAVNKFYLRYSKDGDDSKY
ncbi:hypothetical protein [Macellibacteroides fermentans]|uniref:hypothetical protein n=1 Tax=Macellibacteroides fermentans TaxID=879969 RepID=UPI00406D01F2